MKKKRMSFLALGVFLFLLPISGCAHSVAFKSPNFYKYDVVVPLKIIFYMDKDLKDKMYYGRAVSSGIANRWDVPIGNVVYEYAISYLKENFTSFSESSLLETGLSDSMLLKVVNIDYYMSGQAAHCSLDFIIEDTSGKELFKKTYKEDGPSGFGNVFWGGVFAQKGAIRQSTDVILEKIFKELIRDINTNYKNW